MGKGGANGAIRSHVSKISLEMENHQLTTYAHTFQRILSAFLILILLGTLLSPLQVGAEQQGAAQTEQTDRSSEIRAKVEQAVEKTKNYYLQNPPDYSSYTSHSNYWLLSALWGTGVDLKNDIPWKENASPWNPTSYWTVGKETASSTANEDAGIAIGSIVLGKNPYKFGKRNIMQDLVAKQKDNGSFSTIWGEPWSLIALDLMEAEYDQEKHIQYILSKQNPTTGYFGDSDVTGWMLIALAPHMDRPDVKAAVDKTVQGILENRSKETGEVMGQMFGENANSVAPIINGLAAVGEDLFSEKWTMETTQLGSVNLIERFVDRYQLEDGRFTWQENRLGSWQMATEQGLLAISDAVAGKSTFMRLSDYKQQQLNKETNVSVRVEGIQETLLTDEAVQVQTFMESANAFDATKQALDKANIPFQGATSYISQIGPDKHATFGVWDGWQYIVNNEYPAVSAGDYNLEEGDDIVWFYGNVGDIYQGYDGADEVEELTLRPTISIAPKLLAGKDIEVTVTATHNVFDASYNLVKQNEVAKIQDATIYFDGATYKTDADGVARIPGEKARVGTYELKVTKDVEGSYPRLLRQAKKIIIEEDPDGGVVPSDKTVTLSVEKRTVGLGDSIAPTEVALHDGDTAFTLMKRVADQKEITVDYSGSGAGVYVQAIDGLGEFDHGPQSGWMYSVNGTFPEISAGTYMLQDGDVLRWHYTKDLGQDLQDGTPSDTKIDLQQVISGASKWIGENRDFSTYDHFIDWDVLGLARAGKPVPESYYTAVENYVKAQNGEFRKVTDYERMALAVTAIGKNPKAIAGYDFIEKIYNNPRMTMQGTNGVIFALLALDAKDSKIPEDAVWTRAKLVDWLLTQQNSDGGFPLAEKTASDVDMTAMALQALANYQDTQEVKTATTKAVEWLSQQQLAEGGFQSAGSINSESISQVIIALTSLGIDAEDTRFVKEKGTLLTAFQTFINKDGGMSHTAGGESNYMATQQGLLALAAYDRLQADKTTVYDMSDVETSQPTISFSDVPKDLFGAEEILELAGQGIISGYPDGTFKPKRQVNRGEAAILFMKALDLKVPQAPVGFKDVAKSSIYYEAAHATKEAGIFVGYGTGATFGATDKLSREQMASVIVRAFGLEATNEKVDVKDLSSVSRAHRKDVEILYQNGITSGVGQGKFDPKGSVSRAHFAVFLSRALKNNQ
ncbi:hypothetical protein CF394_06920 [Tetzosporium hominis]|uniref:SLH domain-containing protein n=1 Tax=Tetzosporium hominis TaxID=2020506 RepID=A0A264W4I2_9BACL|nr:hypothetical protein CF394_06920 [Tetzosporium hominis]